jgi:carbon monoxide dehydrogenase subunit G
MPAPAARLHSTMKRYRRLLAATVVCVPLAAITGASMAAVGGDSPIRSIDVQQKAEGYSADVVMIVPVPQSVAWDVLTDFEHQANWVPNVKESKVIKRDGDTLVIEQQGSAKFGLASVPYTSQRRQELVKPTSIHSTQVSGSMRKIDSMMRLEPDGNGTRLNYHLDLVPSLLTVAVVNKQALEKQLDEQFTAIIGEMMRRGGSK